MKKKTWISALALVLALSGLVIALAAYLNSKRRSVGEKDSRHFGDGCCCDETGFEGEEGYSEAESAESLPEAAENTESAEEVEE